MCEKEFIDRSSPYKPYPKVNTTADLIQYTDAKLVKLAQEQNTRPYATQFLHNH